MRQKSWGAKWRQLPCRKAISKAVLDVIAARGNTAKNVKKEHLKEIGGREGIRTPGLLVANEALSQLSYSPTSSKSILAKAKMTANMWGFAVAIMRDTIIKAKF